MVMEYKLIDKELVNSLSFPNEEVLRDVQDVQQRKMDLERALTLGNLEHLKMKIYFEDEICGRLVETTVWGVTSDRIILKQGTVIPINRIHKII
jgi:hypothetical protein